MIEVNWLNSSLLRLGTVDMSVGVDLINPSNNNVSVSFLFADVRIGFRFAV
jgi:hypothetical protein